MKRLEEGFALQFNRREKQNVFQRRVPWCPGGKAIGIVGEWVWKSMEVSDGRRPWCGWRATIAFLAPTSFTFGANCEFIVLGGIPLKSTDLSITMATVARKACVTVRYPANQANAICLAVFVAWFIFIFTSYSQTGPASSWFGFSQV